MAVVVVVRCSKLSCIKAWAIVMMNVMIVHQAAVGLQMENSLTPPPGNSVRIKASTVNGVQVYNCSGGKWMFVNASATLVDSNNSSILIGAYAYVHEDTDMSAVGRWSLNNSDGVVAESGDSVSEVTGRVIAFRGDKSSLPEFLAQASSHIFEGAASLVSYIQQIPSDGGVPPENSCCKKGSGPAHVPFKADYWFWTQDRQPPSSIPAALSASGRKIEGFFATGFVKYFFNGTSWQPKKLNASMYDVPGGTLIGRCAIMSKPDNAGGRFAWEVYNPNGWTVIGKLACPTLQMDSTSLPWALFNVTSGINNDSFLGNITQVQLVSTRGGAPPTQTQAKATVGRVWKTSYSAIYWFYSSA
ncbi:hypothetical protein O6H91_05G069300 [Diphasiastrum complanatum]|uniref:Uncharacterized protein n=1 Tax=Diphasiastrum complanatum TaxID=34168 RepID=A0ACC2DPD7_DIPCM|nr:hypothetical protein O6H91_Y033300 [Diphasiastrum complanatum]KAJ7556114.1 hypothetical protein O6H91_05G069300 [Diphasiastrum complanatum]